MTILVFVLAFSVLVLIHELGHFISARALGIPVEEFGIGFPPRLAKVKRGSTLFTINAIPLGGFVRLKGESSSTDDPSDFIRQSKPRRALVIASGVIMNALLAYALTVVLLVAGVPQNLSHLPHNATVTNAHVEIVGLLPDAPAQQAGIPAGSTIMSITSISPSSIELIQNEIRSHADQPIIIDVRDSQGKDHQYTITPTTLSVDPPVVGIGVQLAAVGTVSYSFIPAMGYGAQIVAGQASMIFTSLGRLVKDLVVGQQLPKDIAGPIGIAVLVGEATRSGWSSLLSLIAILSLNLAVLNVLPIPALDGGRLAFLAVEAVLRRPMRVRLEAMIHQVGFVLLLGLILIITLHDIRTFLF